MRKFQLTYKNENGVTCSHLAIAASSIDALINFFASAQQPCKVKVVAL